jgi:hypothetical protein
VLKITALYLALNPPVYRILQKILSLNLILSEAGENILTEDNFYLEVEDNTP